MPSNTATDFSSPEPRFVEATLALACLNSVGAGALADAAGYARPSLTLVLQGRRRPPPQVIARFAELLQFDSEGFRTQRIDAGLVRKEEHLSQLVRAGFRVKPLFQILSHNEAGGIERLLNCQLPEAGWLPSKVSTPPAIAQQFIAAKISFGQTHRFFILRGSPLQTASLLPPDRTGFPYLRLPKGLHRELPDLETSLESPATPPAARKLARHLQAFDKTPSEAALFEIRGALLDWIREPAGASDLKLDRKTLERNVHETVCRLYRLTPAKGSSGVLVGQRRSGTRTPVCLVISTGGTLKIPPLPGNAYQLVVLHAIDGPTPLFELVFDGPALLASPKPVFSRAWNLEALREKNARIPQDERLQRHE